MESSSAPAVLGPPENTLSSMKEIHGDGEKLSSQTSLEDYVSQKRPENPFDNDGEESMDFANFFLKGGKPSPALSVRKRLTQQESSATTLPTVAETVGSSADFSSQLLCSPIIVKSSNHSLLEASNELGNSGMGPPRRLDSIPQEPSEDSSVRTKSNPRSLANKEEEGSALLTSESKSTNKIRLRSVGLDEKYESSSTSFVQKIALEKSARRSSIGAIYESGDDDDFFAFDYGDNSLLTATNSAICITPEPTEKTSAGLLFSPELLKNFLKSPVVLSEESSSDEDNDAEKSPFIFKNINSKSEEMGSSELFDKVDKNLPFPRGEPARFDRIRSPRRREIALTRHMLEAQRNPKAPPRLPPTAASHDSSPVAAERVKISAISKQVSSAAESNTDKTLEMQERPVDPREKTIRTGNRSSPAHKGDPKISPDERPSSATSETNAVPYLPTVPPLHPKQSPIIVSSPSVRSHSPFNRKGKVQKSSFGKYFPPPAPCLAAPDLQCDADQTKKRVEFVQSGDVRTQQQMPSLAIPLVEPCRTNAPCDNDPHPCKLVDPTQPGPSTGPPEKGVTEEQKKTEEKLMQSSQTENHDSCLSMSPLEHIQLNPSEPNRPAEPPANAATKEQKKTEERLEQSSQNQNNDSCSSMPSLEPIRLQPKSSLKKASKKEQDKPTKSSISSRVETKKTSRASNATERKQLRHMIGALESPGRRPKLSAKEGRTNNNGHHFKGDAKRTANLHSATGRSNTLQQGNEDGSQPKNNKTSRDLVAAHVKESRQTKASPQKSKPTSCSSFDTWGTISISSNLGDGLNMQAMDDRFLSACNQKRHSVPTPKPPGSLGERLARDETKETSKGSYSGSKSLCELDTKKRVVQSNENVNSPGIPRPFMAVKPRTIGTNVDLDSKALDSPRTPGSLQTKFIDAVANISSGTPNSTVADSNTKVARYLSNRVRQRHSTPAPKSPGLLQARLIQEATRSVSTKPFSRSVSLPAFENKSTHLEMPSFLERNNTPSHAALLSTIGENSDASSHSTASDDSSLILASWRLPIPLSSSESTRSSVQAISRSLEDYESIAASISTTASIKEEEKFRSLEKYIGDQTRKPPKPGSASVGSHSRNMSSRGSRGSLSSHSRKHTTALGTIEPIPENERRGKRSSSRSGRRDRSSSRSRRSESSGRRSSENIEPPKSPSKSSRSRVSDDNEPRTPSRSAHSRSAHSRSSGVAKSCHSRSSSHSRSHRSRSRSNRSRSQSKSSARSRSQSRKSSKSGRSRSSEGCFNRRRASSQPRHASKGGNSSRGYYTPQSNTANRLTPGELLSFLSTLPFQEEKKKGVPAPDFHGPIKSC